LWYKGKLLICFSNSKLTIVHILDQLKSMLNLTVCPLNWLNMGTNMIQVGSLVRYEKVKLSNLFYVDIVKSLPLLSTLSNNLFHRLFKLQKIFVFVVIVVSFSFLSISFFYGWHLMYYFSIDRATKLIAKIRQCEIIVRDANRIHHFYSNGTCSCQDHFWCLFLFILLQ
jgi:hypothetical protein